MTSKKKYLGLGEGFGVEMEYMIVNRDSLQVLPISDLLLQEVSGDITADYENGNMAWSNELVLHVLEIKTNGPSPTLKDLSAKFADNVRWINEKLAKHNAMLLPSGAHPLMDPLSETKIWPHEYNEVYALYDRIFNCKGHGWSNLQSTHINLPFANDDEFAKLHAAIRLILPIIPALSASTPILDSSFGGFKDHRLEYYRLNQRKIPSIAGKVIPERAFTQEDYEKMVFEPIRKEIKAYDTENILSKYFLNSRGAIARFDRMAIEIRIIDIQEAPRMDIAILELINQAINYLISLQAGFFDRQKAWSETDLSTIFCEVIKEAENTVISNVSYLEEFGFSGQSAKASELWQFIMKQTNFKNDDIQLIMQEGTLSSRILSAVNHDFSKSNLISVYKKLAQCLAENKPFSNTNT